MAEELPDSQLDATLRDVPLPEDYVAQLRSSLTPSDGRLDEQLRGVRVPGDLAARLQRIPDDSVLDAQIAAAPMPASLERDLRGIPGESSQPIPLHRRRTLAAATLAALTLSLALLVLLGNFWSSVPSDGENPVGTGSIVSDPTIDDPAGEGASVGEAIPVETFADIWGAEDLLDDGIARLAVHQPERTLFGPTGEPRLMTASLPSELPAGGAVAQWTTMLNGPSQMFDDAMLLKFGVLGSPQLTSELAPELETLWLPAPRGVEPPRVRGYDRVFFLKHRVSPPISPAADPALATLAVPLTTQTTSLRRVEQLAVADRSPEPSEVRVEDFLAAIDYHFVPAAVGNVAMRTAAGPSPFGANGAQLLQVGVQAGSPARPGASATHLVLALDASAGMQRSGRWQRVVSAIEKLMADMQTGDRLSLVLFFDDIVEPWETIDSSQTDEVVSRLLQFRPRGSANLAAGLRQGVSLALSEELTTAPSKRLVLMTNDPTAIAGSAWQNVEQMLLAAGEQGVGFDLIDLADRETPGGRLAEIAPKLDGRHQRAADVRGAYLPLLERLTGQPTTIAAEAKLTIRFNPAAVSAYRLIGHEANSLAGISPPSLAVQLHGRDAATALIEIWLAPNDVDDVAEAIIEWKSPGQTEAFRTTQRISRLQFAATFEEAAPSLQAAALAAETAEQLRGSREALREVGLGTNRGAQADRVLSVAEQASPLLEKWAELQRVLALNRAAGSRQP